MVIYTPEQKQQLASIVSNLTPLPPTSSPPPDIPSGTVALFAHHWDSKRLDINTSDYIVNKRHRVPAALIDSATWVAWNLPVGTVMTMTDWLQDSTGLTNASLDGAAGSVDFVGSGQTRSAEMTSILMEDHIAGFFWREVDLAQGAIELFQTQKFKHNFSTLFLSEWPRDTPVNISDWWLGDRVSSFRWKTLTDRQTATLYSGNNGTGTRYDNIKGWGSFKEIAEAQDYGIDDCISSFSWSSVNPKKEIIDPIVIPASLITGSTSLYAHLFGDNATSQSGQSKITLHEEEVQSLTVETSDSHHAGMTMSVTQSFRSGVDGIATAETNISLGFSYDFTTTKTVTRTTTKIMSINLEQTVIQPPWKHWDAHLTADIGTMPPTDFQAKATRWYDYPVANGVRDPAFNDWYKREELVTFRVGGSLAVESKFDVIASDLPDNLRPPPGTVGA
jgi:hypothetical protein